MSNLQKVTISEVYSRSRDILKKHILDNISDPERGRVNGNRKWIYREEPDTTSATFQGYPIIILQSADQSDDLQTIDQNLSDGTLLFELVVLVEFNNTNVRVDDLSDKIRSLFRLKKHLNHLAGCNLHEPKIESSSYIPSQNVDGVRTVGRSFTISLQSTLEDNS
jgi:hypothetical protein